MSVGIVGERGADADGDGVRVGAQAMHLAARRFAREPAGPPGVIGDRAVEREGELELHERPVARERVKEGGVELARRGLLDADVDLDARGAQPLGAAARDGVRIRARDDDARTPAASSASVHGGVLPW